MILLDPSAGLMVLAWCLSAVTGVAVAQKERGLRLLKDDKCPLTGVEEATLTVQKGRRIHRISFLGRGDYGCAYKVLDPWKDPFGKTVTLVAKTMRVDRPIQLFSENEIDALEAIEELYGIEKDQTGKEWILIKYHSGHPVVQTKKWKERFPKGYNTDTSPQGVKDCTAFMKQIYMSVAHKQRWYADLYGWESNDRNWMNFLFDNDLRTVNVIDWTLGRDVLWENPDSVYQRWMHALEFESLLPIEDIEASGYGKVQGICQSDERDFGVPWVPRLARLAGPTAALSY